MLQPITLPAQVRTNALHMVIAIAQLGPSQMRHMIKHVHGSVCQMSYNCLAGASAHFQGHGHGSEEFAEMALVMFMRAESVKHGR